MVLEEQPGNPFWLCVEAAFDKAQQDFDSHPAKAAAKAAFEAEAAHLAAAEDAQDDTVGQALGFGSWTSTGASGVHGAVEPGAGLAGEATWATGVGLAVFIPSGLYDNHNNMISHMHTQAANNAHDQGMAALLALARAELDIADRLAENIAKCAEDTNYPPGPPPPAPPPGAPDTPGAGGGRRHGGHAPDPKSPSGGRSPKRGSSGLSVHSGRPDTNPYRRRCGYQTRGLGGN